MSLSIVLSLSVYCPVSCSVNRSIDQSINRSINIVLSYVFFPLALALALSLSLSLPKSYLYLFIQINPPSTRKNCLLYRNFVLSTILLGYLGRVLAKASFCSPSTSFRASSHENLWEMTRFNVNVELIYCVLIIKYLGTLRWDGQALVTCQDVFWTSNPISDNSQASFPCFGWGDGAYAELVFFNLKTLLEICRCTTCIS